MSYVKIGNTEYSKKAISELSLSKFKKMFSHLGDNAETIYYKVTGKKKPKKKQDSED